MRGVQRLDERTDGFDVRQFFERIMNRVGQRGIVRGQGYLLQPFDDGHRIGVLPVGQMGSEQTLDP